MATACPVPPITTNLDQALADNQALLDCMARTYGPTVTVGAGASVVPGGYQAASLTYRPQQVALRGFDPIHLPLLTKIVANQPKELFPGALLLAELVTTVAAPYVGIPKFIVSGATAATQIARDNMALNIGGILQTAGGILGGINTSGLGNISQIIGGAANIASQFFPTSTPTYGPIYSPLPVPAPQPPMTRTMAAAPIIASSASMVARVVAPILFKISQTLGKRVSLQGAIAIIRKAGKFLSSPEAIAAALGITLAEMATLIVSRNSIKTRHMNPANSKALRRAARRIKSFHRMCGTIDLLKSRGRRTAVARCGTCRKSPCRC